MRGWIAGALLTLVAGYLAACRLSGVREGRSDGLATATSGSAEPGRACRVVGVRSDRAFAIEVGNEWGHLHVVLVGCLSDLGALRSAANGPALPLARRSVERHLERQSPQVPRDCSAKHDPDPFVEELNAALGRTLVHNWCLIDPWQDF